jgi:hypothetical protein
LKEKRERMGGHTARPSTMVHSPLAQVTGNEYMRPSATPYLLPVESTAIET